MPRTAWLIAGATASIVGALTLCFMLEVALIGAVRHGRDQQVRYAGFRLALANATAPVGQTDENGKLYPLGTAVALLEIPEIGLREVVAEGTTSPILTSGPGHRRDSVLPGQPGTSLILGRKAGYGGPFRHLTELHPGSTVLVTTGQGTHRFQVIGLRRAGDPQPTPLADGHGRLILMTATGPPFMPKGVLRVDADLVSNVMPAPRAVLSSNLLPKAEQQMAGSRAALLPAVLWGQALLLAAIAVTWLWARWGRWQAWVVGVPLLGTLGIVVADQVAGMLPNLL